MATSSEPSPDTCPRPCPQCPVWPRAHLGTQHASSRLTRTVSTWTEQQKLVANHIAPGDAFGYSVAVAGDTVVVRAPVHGEGRGAVYVFTRSGSVWTERRELIASDAAPSDLFGYSVAVDGWTLLGGAICDDDAADNAGSAWVFALDYACSR